jgi:hypothetical protein
MMRIAAVVGARTNCMKMAALLEKWDAGPA